MVVADIPGLIEGAADGKGLGHQFLRHVERARVLCILLDLAPWDDVGPKEQEAALLRELEAYQPDLLDRPRLVIGSKADMAPEHNYEGLVISSITGDGLQRLTGKLADLVREARKVEAEADESTIVIHRPVAETVDVERIGNCLLYTSPSPRDRQKSRMPSSA